MNRTGEITDPCGTPAGHDEYVDRIFSILTCCVLCDRKLLIHCQKVLLIWCSASFVSNVPSHSKEIKLGLNYLLTFCLSFCLFPFKPVHTKQYFVKCLKQMVVLSIILKCLPSSLCMAWPHFLHKYLSFVNLWNVKNEFSPLWFSIDLHNGTQQEWGITAISLRWIKPSPCYVYTFHWLRLARGLPNDLTFMRASQWHN